MMGFTWLVLVSSPQEDRRTHKNLGQDLDHICSVASIRLCFVYYALVRLVGDCILCSEIV